MGIVSQFGTCIAVTSSANASPTNRLRELPQDRGNRSLLIRSWSAVCQRHSSDAALESVRDPHRFNLVDHTRFSPRVLTAGMLEPVPEGSRHHSQCSLPCLPKIEFNPESSPHRQRTSTHLVCSLVLRASNKTAGSPANSRFWYCIHDVLLDAKSDPLEDDHRVVDRRLIRVYSFALCNAKR